MKVWASGKGVTVEAAKDKGKLAVTVAADAVPGVYWLRASNDDGASGLRPFIVGMLPEVAEKEPNDDARKPQVLDNSAVVVNGRLDKNGDVDCFAVTLKKGQTLVASLEANRTLKSPMDGVLQILSADGFVLDQNNDFHGLDPQLAFTAPKDGLYVARVFAFPATPDASIRFAGADTYVYRLTLTTAGFADFAVPLAVSREKPGSVEVVGWNIPDEAKSLPVPTPGAGEDVVTLFDAKLANSLRLRVEPHPVLKAPPPEPQAPPFSVTGRLEKPGVPVAVPFTGKKGQLLTLQVQSRSLGLPVDPVVRVLDKEGKQLARAEPGKLHADTALAFTVPADGLYRIEVSDLYGAGSPRHAFLLRVQVPEPDYDLTVVTDRFAVVPGKPLDLPVKVNRRNKFTKPVEVTAEVLPDGVKFEVKPPAGKPEPDLVLVTLSAEKPSAGGAFRLVGKVKDEPALTRVARAPLPEFEDTTADLWVTVTDTPVSPPPPKKK